MAVVDNERPKGSQHDDAGQPKFARGGAGIEGGSHADMTADDVRDAQNATPKGDIEERRETQQVLRPSTDGIGEGLTKDAG